MVILIGLELEAVGRRIERPESQSDISYDVRPIALGHDAQRLFPPQFARLELVLGHHVDDESLAGRARVSVERADDVDLAVGADFHRDYQGSISVK